MSVKLRKKQLSSGKQSLYLDIYFNGKRQYEFLNLYTSKNKVDNKEIVKLAENIRAKRELEIQHSEHGFIPAFKKKVCFVEYFERLAKAKPEGEKAWGNCLTHLKTFTNGTIRFSAITEEWLETFKAYLLTKVAANTSHTYFSKVKAALRQAVKDKIITSNPSEMVSQVKKEDTERNFLTMDEINRLNATECYDKEVKRAFLFACYAGLRLSDIEALTWSNIQDGNIHFRQRKTKGVERLPLSEMAKQLIHSSLGNVIPLPSNKIFNLPSRAQITLVLNKWVKNASIDKQISFHCSRHTFATLALTQGVDLYTVSKLLGHKDLRTTQVYAKIIDEKLKQAVAMMPSMVVSK